MGTNRRTGGVLLIVAGVVMFLVTLLWNEEGSRVTFLLAGAAFLAAGAALVATSRPRS